MTICDHKMYERKIKMSDYLDVDLQPLMSIDEFQRHVLACLDDGVMATPSTSSQTGDEEYARIKANLSIRRRYWNQVLREWARDKGWLPTPSNQWRFKSAENGQGFVALLGPDGISVIESRHDPVLDMSWLWINGEWIERFLINLNGKKRNSSSHSYSEQNGSVEIPNPCSSQTSPHQQ